MKYLKSSVDSTGNVTFTMCQGNLTLYQIDAYYQGAPWPPNGTPDECQHWAGMIPATSRRAVNMLYPTPLTWRFRPDTEI